MKRVLIILFLVVQVLSVVVYPVNAQTPTPPNNLPECPGYPPQYPLSFAYVQRCGHCAQQNVTPTVAGTQYFKTIAVPTIVYKTLASSLGHAGVTPGVTLTPTSLGHADVTPGVEITNTPTPDGTLTPFPTPIPNIDGYWEFKSVRVYGSAYSGYRRMVFGVNYSTPYTGYNVDDGWKLLGQFYGRTWTGSTTIFSKYPNDPGGPYTYWLQWPQNSGQNHYPSYPVLPENQQQRDIFATVASLPTGISAGALSYGSNNLALTNEWTTNRADPTVWVIYGKWHEPAPIPTATPTITPTVTATATPLGLCSQYEYMNYDPVANLGDFSVTDGECVKIVPDWSLDIPEVNIIGLYEFTGYSLTIPSLAVCPKWVSLGQMSIMGFDLPADIMLVPVIMFLVGFIAVL